MHITDENKRHRPSLTEYRHGVKAPLYDCLSMTLAERLQTVDLSKLDQVSKVYFKYTWGLDGSGEHSNYNQLTKVHYTTKQVVSVCFAVKEMTVEDSQGVRIVWNSSVKGANKPQNVRPLALFPAKEEKELLEDFVPKVEAEIKKINTEGIELKIKDGTTLTANCEKSSLSMADGKMVTTLLQLGGSYCTMCTQSQAQCHNPSVIEKGFTIDRSIESLKELALSLADPDTGDIVKEKGDYQTRKGVCDHPITETDLTKNIPVCHAKIRAFEWSIELITRELSHKKWWCVSKPVKYTTEEKDEYKLVREHIKKELFEKLAVNIGNPGDMVTGNAFQAFSSDHARDTICNLVDEHIREELREIHLGLSAAVKVINSQKRKVNIDKLRELTKEVNLRIVNTFPWAVISPSVHRILAHSWERIQLNDGFGLGDESEEGLEALNKWIRKLRVGGARKTSTEDNFTDTFNHLWDRSRPIIVEMERVIKRKKQKVMIETEIESLVNSLFLEDNQN